MHSTRLFEPVPISRRRLIGTTAGVSLGFGIGRSAGGSASAHPLLAPAAQATAPVEELVIDLNSEPANLDPATTYEVNGWSIVHAVYDSLLQYGPEGQIELILAESFDLIDPTTFEIKLRPGIAFHNGEPFDAASVAFSLAHIVAEETASSIAGNFAPIADVTSVDPTTVRLILSQPAPWLPAQIAAWLACLPPVYAAGNDFGQAPVGTGPYRFVEWQPGERIVLEANPDYPPDSPKGVPIAKRAVFRFVTEPSTRVADLLAGTAHIVRAVPVDQVASVTEAGANAVVTPVSGSAWIRIPTDEAPFSDVRVRQALNYAIDVPTIVEALLGGEGRHLPNFFVEHGLGFDPNLAPYPYDPEKAKALLAAAGLENGFETRLAHATSERADLVEAVAGYLGDVGIDVTVEPVEIATFNGTWTDPAAAPLRFVTWRPLFDPFTLLNLLVSNEGFLSRHDNPNAQALIDAGATEVDPEQRAETYRQLGQVLRDEPAAVYLWSLTAIYGIAAEAPTWSPRPDEYIIPTARP